MGPTAVVFVVVIVLVVLAVGTVLRRRHFRADGILVRWAQDNGFEILSFDRCWFKGPFLALNSHEVYYVTVRSTKGQLRRGWVRCGGWVLGLLSDQTKVRWDDRDPRTKPETLEDRATNIARRFFDDYEAEIKQTDPNASENPLTAREQEGTTGGWIVNGNVWQMLLIEEGGDWLLVELTVNGRRLYFDEGARLEDGVWHLR